MKYLLTLVLLCVIGLPACYQDDSNKYTSNTGGLVFTKTEVSNGILFQWEPSTISNFTEYVITKHSNSTATLTSLSELNRLSPDNIVARVKNRNVTSSKDSTSTASAYYRLYLVYGSHFTASDELFQLSNYYTLGSQFFSQLLLDHRKGDLYLFQHNLVEIIDLNRMLQKDLISTTRSISSYSMSLGYDQNGNTEVYSSNGDKILVFNGEKLDVIDTICNNPKKKFIYNTVTDQNSNIFYTEADSVAKYDPLTKKISKFGSNGSFQEAIQVSRDGKTIITGTGFAFMYQYLLDQNNTLISVKRSPNTIEFSNRNFILANTETTIVAGSSGAIYNKDFVWQKNIANEIVGYLESIFDPEDKFIYSIGRSTNFVFKFEHKPGYKFIEKIKIRINPTRIFAYNGHIFAIGNLVDPNTGISSVLLERVKL